MKWFAAYIGLNSAEYIKYSLESIKDFIKSTDGKIIFIEGSTQYAKMVGPDGNSKDNTKQIIETFIQQNPDLVIYKRLGKVADKRVLRNAYLNEIRTLSTDEENEMVLVIDDDELYKTEDLKRLDLFLSRHKDIWYVFNEQRWFWKDFKHVAIANEVSCQLQIKKGNRKDKIFYDMLGNRIRQGQFHERIFRWRNDIQHSNSHATIADGQGRELYIESEYESHRIIYSGCPRYHYGYLTSTERMAERFKYYEQRDKNKTVNDDLVWKDNYGHYLLTGTPGNKAMNVFEYLGDHPNAIKNHPYYKKGICPMMEDANEKTQRRTNN